MNFYWMLAILAYVIIWIFVGALVNNEMNIDSPFDIIISLFWPISLPVIVVDIIIQKHIDRKKNK